MKHNLGIVILAISLIACGGSKDSEVRKHPLSGLWRGVLTLQGHELPFNFRIRQAGADSLILTLINGQEQLEAGLVEVIGDSIHMPMHIFDTQLVGILTEEGQIEGYFVKNYTDGYKIPFRATQHEAYRFKAAEVAKEPSNFSGKWQVNFKGGEGLDTSFNAVGQFEQQANLLSGTFLTPTGDYRYLEGYVNGSDFSLSAFDGEHAFLFNGQLNASDTINGMFYSGIKWNEAWAGYRNDKATLPSPDSLTFMKPGYSKLQFSFPNLAKDQVSLSDDKFDGKVVIVQLLGSWCPNCMDETKFLAEWYKKHKGQAVEIIGLAYEQKDDFDYAKTRLEKMKAKLGVEYELLVAGTADKESAAKTLPMLNKVLAFPTTIFIDKTGRVRRIHTGFSGPGTGQSYSGFVDDFNLFTDKLLNE